ncbi:MAG: YgiT-type zinc finger protein [bacterium]
MWHERVPNVLEHYERWIQDKELVVFKNVSVEECPECGEVYFSADVLDAMDGIIQKKAQPEEEIKVPVYPLEDV